jgi:hypothetical protein
MTLSMLPDGIDLSLVARGNIAAVLAALFSPHLPSSNEVARQPARPRHLR